LPSNVRELGENRSSPKLAAPRVDDERESRPGFAGRTPRLKQHAHITTQITAGSPRFWRTARRASRSVRTHARPNRRRVRFLQILQLSASGREMQSFNNRLELHRHLEIDSIHVYRGGTEWSPARYSMLHARIGGEPRRAPGARRGRGIPRRITHHKHVSLQEE